MTVITIGPTARRLKNATKKNPLIGINTEENVGYLICPVLSINRTLVFPASSSREHASERQTAFAPWTNLEVNFKGFALTGWVHNLKSEIVLTSSFSRHRSTNFSLPVFLRDWTQNLSAWPTWGHKAIIQTQYTIALRQLAANLLSGYSSAVRRARELIVSESFVRARAPNGNTPRAWRTMCIYRYLKKKKIGVVSKRWNYFILFQF